ncbi:beta-phosphoglucomutase [Candidatus Xianfuyuplasma coldseepsis]|uniref:Beta-phosphoglucomutase n=1 Tax=Candidatus Xianfuyuplasma coldseepsis TaxID=2782163 RepID=A0A7L7KSP2_9MOLU|nr:beta-phosphoglucomutase [Xianfuyuplasma coldseepsis]QMS84798.1 beta-phosphoglucomutase [Xianfuyuplasma coldseepsis]
MPLSKKLFIFDLDGVLTSTSHEHLQAWTLLCDELGIKIGPDIEEKTKGVSRLDSLNIVLSSSPSITAFTEQEKIELATRKNQIYQSLIQEYTPKNLYKGVLQLLEYLHKNNILVALGSASKNGPMLLDKLGITDYFDYIVDPSTVRGKPHPDIFLKAMNHFSLQPEQCVGVEDAIAGIHAINQANMYSIGIGHKDTLSHASIVYPSIDHIRLDDIDTLIKEGT